MMKTQPFFNRLRDSRKTRIISAFLVLNLLAEIVSPSLALALTSGAASPEFSSFEPVATTDMVNDFSGSFTYNLPVLNVPGPDGGGYSMSLAYHAGSSAEEEASWVGMGWTLNPGSINRNKRGYADEFRGVNVEQYNKVRPNWTHSTKFDCNIEINSSDQSNPTQNGEGFLNSLQRIKSRLGLAGFGKNEETGKSKDPADISVSLSHTIRYNNYTGFSIANGFGVKAFGAANLSMNRSGGQNTFGFSVDPNFIVRAVVTYKESKRSGQQEKTFKKSEKFKRLAQRAGMFLLRQNVRKGIYSYFTPSYEAPALAYSVARRDGISWNFSGSVQFNPVAPIGLQVGIAGNVNVSATEAREDYEAYGYMYSSWANDGGSQQVLYDYQLEKESTFNKHDKNLGIPFNNADLFAVSGNGLVGSFKLLHDRIGSFYPNKTNSNTKIFQAGVELGFGGTNTAGLDVGIGIQRLSVQGKWPKMPDNTSMSTKLFSGGKPRMRFQNDPGGEVRYSDNYNKLVYAEVTGSHQLDLSTDYDLGLNAAKAHGSSFVDYTQKSHVTNPTIDGVYVTSKDGGKANYGLPVYTRNEAELTIGLPGFHDGKSIVHNDLHHDNPELNSTVQGRKVAAEYAASYLLTSNTTYNYVDADNIPGPSAGDFGGWTRFDYRQAYGRSGGPGQSAEWYRFRTPYTGLSYDRGRLVDPEDGTGSVSSGERQVYYLKCIETKSHIAFFVTNSMSAGTFTANFPETAYPYLYKAGQPVPTVTAHVAGSGQLRYDGVDAAGISGGKDQAANDPEARGTHALDKLERIVLFAKSDLDKPLTTTFFDYDYSLIQGIPNSLAPASSPSKDRGKLTLKRIWTESGGVLRSQIAPYEFDYEYFHEYPQVITDKYGWARTEFNDVYTSHDARQNPVYHPSQLDAWGNYQDQGVQRFEKMQTWLSQRQPSPNFDPAAWQLKRIKLPSGGEIHVHYEQKDYMSVQDQRPTAMVSLLPDDNKDGYSSDESVFCINANDLEAGGSISTYTAILHDYFINQNNKLYFKVLYAYTEDGVPILNTEHRQFEYATGYTAVNKISLSGGGKILLHLGDLRENGENGKKDKTLPRYVCYQDLLTNGGTNLGRNASSYKEFEYTSDAYPGGSLSNFQVSKKAAGEALKTTGKMFVDWVTGKVKNVPKNKACKTINFELSYFKLPVLHAKKGGGIRVKRLLTYDPGISGESGDAMLYGSEYIYRNEDGSSSGVATNEPAALREENTLVGLLERKKQKWLNKIMNGKDTKFYEGPVGENVLPGAEVSHARVVIRNIHSGKSSTGYMVNTYHTAKEHPMTSEFSAIDKSNKTYRKLNLSIPTGYVNLDFNRAWVTQGYLFKLNDMHGKVGSKAVYPGDYDPFTFREPAYVNKTTYHYSRPGDKVTSMVFDPGTQEFQWEQLRPGTEEDYTIFTSSVKDRSMDVQIEVDFNLTLPIVPSWGQKPAFNFSEDVLCQHLTSKVVRQASYLLYTTSVTDGVAQTSANLAYDRYTGDPVLTRTFDGYMSPGSAIYTQAGGGDQHSGYYYSLNIPASWMYASLGPKTMNAANTNQLMLSAGSLVTYGENALQAAISNTTLNAWSPYTNAFSQVVSATAVTYTNNWFSSASLAEYPAVAASTVNPAQTLTQVNSFWYPERTFSYKDGVVSANASGGKIYKGGVTATDFRFFDWLAYTPGSTVTPEWYSDSKVTRYSPHGYPVEEEDVLAIKSSARFGYDHSLPVLVAQNSAYEATRFTDFEYGFSGSPHLQTGVAHTGRASYLLSADPSYTAAAAYPVDVQRGLSARLWLKSALSNDINNINYGLRNPDPQFKLSMGGKQFDFRSIAQTGEWTLYSAEITDFQGLGSGQYTIQLKYNTLASERVYIDDLRLQPLDASMNCSVYYADQKLAAQFDDQHFAVLYEYNGQGQLIRKSIETERGRKVLQEQQHHTPLRNKVN